MKKLLLMASLGYTLAQAVPLIDLDIGGGIWNTAPSGTLDVLSNNIDLADTAGFDATQSTYAYVQFEHPIPIVPNIRVEYVNPTFSGDIASFTFPDGTTASASHTLTLTQLDGIIYWDLLGLVPLPWLTFNAGLDIKSFSGKYEATATGVDPYAQDFNLPVPTLYLNPHVDIPLTGIGFDVNVKYLGSNLYKSSVLDLAAKVSYTMDFIPLIQPGIEAGYRMQEIKLDAGDINVENFNADIKMDGVFVGAYLHF